MREQPALDKIATIDIRQRQAVRLGVLRLMYPAFAEELELGRYLRRLLSSGRYGAVHPEPHRDANGRLSPHVFDVFASAVAAAPQAGLLHVTPSGQTG